jgi:chaperonin GroES
VLIGTLQRGWPNTAQNVSAQQLSKPVSQGGGIVNIRPLQDRVLVKRIEQEEQVRGGIIIPDTAKEKPQQAEVVAVGPGKVNDEGKRSPVDVKQGDKILIGKYSGSEIRIDEEDYVILREDEILAVVA